jgi:translation initiation factor 3 subunit L
MYYAGFAYLMIRRYVDAIKVFNAVLVYIARTQTYLAQSPQFDQITKKNEQLYALLAIALALSPQNKLVEETVSSQLREKHGDKLQRIQGVGYEVDAIYDELFSFACPKFITPSTPNWDEPPVNFNQDAYRLQLKIFLTDVRQQQRGQQIRSYLKLYTTISVSKLASFVGINEATVRSNLLTYKHKTHVVDSVDGSIYRTSDLDFSIEGDMIHVAESKSTQRFGDFFVRNIIKFDDVVRDLEGVDIKEVLLNKKEAA